MRPNKGKREKKKKKKKATCKPAWKAKLATPKRRKSDSEICQNPTDACVGTKTK